MLVSKEAIKELEGTLPGCSLKTEGFTIKIAFTFMNQRIVLIQHLRVWVERASKAYAANESPEFVEEAYKGDLKLVLYSIKKVIEKPEEELIELLLEEEWKELAEELLKAYGREEVKMEKKS